MLDEEILVLDEVLHSVASAIDTTRINPTNTEQIKRGHQESEPAKQLRCIFSGERAGI